MNCKVDIENKKQYLSYEEENCSICLSKLNNEIFTCDSCKNSFHLICMIKWFNESRTCPICRKKINCIKLTDKLNNIRSYKQLDNILNEFVEDNSDDDYSEMTGEICKWICSIILSVFILTAMTAIIISKL